MLYLKYLFSLPFAYSINNEELGKISANPNYDTETVCVKKESCGGMCMKETFLEVLWSKCGSNVYAHTHLSKRTIIFVFKYLF